MKFYTPHNKKIAITVIGYTNLNLLGKKNSLTVYTSKAEFIENNNKAIQEKRSLYKATKQFATDFATSLQGLALKAKFWTAKRILRVKGYSWDRYIDLCNALRMVKNYNLSVNYLLKIKL